MMESEYITKVNYAEVCNHGDFLPYGSLVLMKTTSKCDESFKPQLMEAGIVRILIPTTFFAYCPVCNSRITRECLTTEEVETRVNCQWDDYL